MFFVKKLKEKKLITLEFCLAYYYEAKCALVDLADNDVGLVVDDMVQLSDRLWLAHMSELSKSLLFTKVTFFVCFLCNGLSDLRAKVTEK